MTHSPWLPDWLRVVWAVLLFGVVVLHAAHATVMSGQRRWWHVGHTAMAVGMMLMYLLPRASMSASGPYTAGLVLFAALAVVVLVTAGVLWWREGAFNALWAASALDLFAMTYMLLPMPARTSLVGYAFIVYLTASALAWAFDLPGRVLAPQPVSPGGAVASMPPEDVPESRLTADSGRDVPPSLAVMAASMAYMLVAM